jgi:hypothetical protein
MARGDWTELDSTWPHLDAATGLVDHLYAASDGALWRIDATGAYQQVGDEEWRPHQLVGVAGHLVALDRGGALYRVDPADGSWVQLDGDWSSAIAMTAGGDAVFVIERSGSLYRVEVADGSYHHLGDGFERTVAFAAAAGGLVTIEGDGTMYRVSARDAEATLVDTAWAGTRALAGDDHRLYAQTGESLYAVDPGDGAYEPIGEGTWNTRILVVLGGALHAFEQAGSLYRVQL